MFKVVVSLKGSKPNDRSYESFEAAFTSFFNRINRMMKRGTTYQELESMCWIEYTFERDGQQVCGPVGWYDARDFAYAVGVMQDGKLVKNPPPVDVTRVQDFFIQTVNEQLAFQMTDFMRTLMNSLRELRGMIEELPSTSPA